MRTEYRPADVPTATTAPTWSPAPSRRQRGLLGRRQTRRRNPRRDRRPSYCSQVRSPVTDSLRRRRRPDARASN